MIQITPQMRVLVCVESVDFRREIDGLGELPDGHGGLLAGRRDDEVDPLAAGETAVQDGPLLLDAPLDHVGNAGAGGGEVLEVGPAGTFDPLVAPDPLALDLDIGEAVGLPFCTTRPLADLRSRLSAWAPPIHVFWPDEDFLDAHPWVAHLDGNPNGRRTEVLGLELPP